MSGPSALLEVKGVTSLRGGRPVLDSVSLTLEEGQCLALCGPSGCGKTTLLRAVAGLDPIDRGEILLGGCAAGPGSAQRERAMWAWSFRAISSTATSRS